MPPLTASFSATYPTSSLDFWPQPPPTTAPGGPGAGESKPSSQEQAAPPEQAAGGGSSPGVPKGCSTWPRHRQRTQSCSPPSHFRRGHDDKKKQHSAGTFTISIPRAAPAAAPRPAAEPWLLAYGQKRFLERSSFIIHFPGAVRRARSPVKAFSAKMQSC